MKNIHLIPTDKVSRLYLSDYGKELNLSGYPLRNYITGQHIYITNSEEIKEGDWFLHPFNTIHKAGGNLIDKDFKKIILTTDVDLIKDGVQAIDDEFLEWFVNNPSCEEVEVEIETTSIQLPQQQLSENSYDLAFRCIDKKVYKIIIPKEEPKQITSLDGDGLGGIPKGILTMLIGKKQETLEEAAEKRYPEDGSFVVMDIDIAEYQQFAFIEGAKWQQENSQSIVPYDAYNIEVFNIEADEDGKLFAYIGYKISNGNFHFNVVPFTEPKKEIKLEDVFNEEHYEIKEKLIKEQKPQDKTYTEQEVKYLLEVQRGNCYVALLSHTKNDDIASVALGAPEPGGRNGTWVK